MEAGLRCRGRHSKVLGEWRFRCATRWADNPTEAGVGAISQASTVAGGVGDEGMFELGPQNGESLALSAFRHLLLHLRGLPVAGGENPDGAMSFNSCHNRDDVVANALSACLDTGVMPRPADIAFEPDAAVVPLIGTTVDSFALNS